MEETSRELNESLQEKAGNVTDEAAYTETFADGQQSQDEDREEESVPLAGEIYSYDTYFTEENELADS